MYIETPEGKKLAEWLFWLGAVRFAKPDEPGWRLKLHEYKPDAPLSPIYFNLRTPENPKSGRLDPQTLDAIAIGLGWLVDQNGIDYTAVCGIPHAGEPIAEAFLARRPSKKLALVKTGDDANGRSISGVRNWGNLELGNRVLLLDDVITSADTKIEAITAFYNVALSVSGLLVIIDREQGGTEELTRRQVRVHSLFSVRVLLIFYFTQNLITQETYDRAMAYLNNQGIKRNPVFSL